MRILIADDDGVSLRFLSAACRALGCECAAVEDGTAALRTAARSRFDLLLLDVNMPGSGGVELLDSLRRQGSTARAIATSADVDQALTARLLAGGFAGVLAKPVSIDRLAGALRGNGVEAASADSIDAPLLDDAAALAAIGGDADSLRALRGLLRIELEDLIGQLDGDVPDFVDRLHRLVASCGFCGAAALGAASQRLHRALRGDDLRTAELRVEFVAVCQATLAVLSER